MVKSLEYLLIAHHSGHFALEGVDELVTLDLVLAESKLKFVFSTGLLLRCYKETFGKCSDLL